MEKILTIQDISCVGQCSLTVALPVISAFGIETCILPSAVLSTHTGGFKGYTFRDLTDDFPSVIGHWKKEGIRFDGFYTGYIGNPKQIDYILQIFDELSKDGAKTTVDPAMADYGKLYSGFDENFVEEMKRLIAKADYALPNITESAFLTGTEYRETHHTKEYIEKLCVGIKELGAKNVVLKGVNFKDGEIGVATYDGNELSFHTHERIDKNMHGTGDVYASCFVGATANGAELKEASAVAANLTLSAIRKTLPDKNHWYGVKFEKIIPEIVGFTENRKR